MDSSERSSSQNSSQHSENSWRRRDSITLGAILIFFALWTYTELNERASEARFKEDFRQFHDAGGRFTKEDGELLEERVRHLETHVHRVDTERE